MPSSVISNESLESEVRLEQDYLMDTVYSALAIPLAVAVIVGNVCLLVALHRRPHTAALQPPRGAASTTAPSAPLVLTPNVIICNLLCVDIVTGVSVLLSALLQSAGGHRLASVHGSLCNLWSSAQVFPVAVMFMLLVCLSVDRFLASVQPTRYADAAIKKRPGVFCAAAWLYGAAIALALFAFSPNATTSSLECKMVSLPMSYLLFFITIHLIPCCIISIVLFVLILRVLRMHTCKIQVTNTMTYEHLLEDTKLAKSYFVVTMTNVILWLPFIIILLVTLLLASAKNTGLDMASRLALLIGYAGNLHFLFLLLLFPKVQAYLRKLYCSCGNSEPVTMRVPSRSG